MMSRFLPILLSSLLIFNSHASECLKSAKEFSRPSPFVGQYKKFKRPKIIIKSLLGENPEIYARKLNAESFDSFLAQLDNQNILNTLAKDLEVPVEDLIEIYFKNSSTHLHQLVDYFQATDQKLLKSLKDKLKLKQDDFLSLVFKSYPVSLFDIEANTETLLRLADAYSVDPEVIIIGLIREGNSFDDLKMAIKKIDEAPVKIPFRKKLYEDSKASLKLTGTLFSGTLSYAFIKAPKTFPREFVEILNKQVPRAQKAEMLFYYLRKLPANVIQGYFRTLMNKMVVERVMDPKIYNAIFYSIFLDAGSLFVTHLAKNGWARMNDLVVANLNFAFLEIAMWMLEGNASKKLLKEAAKGVAQPQGGKLAPTKLAIKAMKDAISSVPKTMLETVKEAPMRFLTMAPINLIGFSLSRLIIDSGAPMGDNLTKIAMDFLYTQLFLVFWYAPRVKATYKSLGWAERHLLWKPGTKGFKALNISLLAANMTAGALTYVWGHDWFYKTLGFGEMLEPQKNEDEKEKQDASVTNH